MRVYTRDTGDFIELGWEAQALWWHILRKVDRAGLMQLSKGTGWRGLAALVRMPVEVVEEAMPRLLEDGCIELHDRVLVVRNFVEAQEVSMSTNTRKRESRERARDRYRAGIDPAHRQSVIYFLQSENGGHVKIGHAEDLAKRVCNLQTSRPDTLIVLASVPGTVGDERALHAAFADHRDKGEWFQPVPALMDLIQAVSRDGLAAIRQVTNRDATPVTGHESGRVTPCRSDPCLAVPDRSDPCLAERDLAPAHDPPTPEPASAPVPSEPERVDGRWSAETRRLIIRRNERHPSHFTAPNASEGRWIEGRLMQGFPEADIEAALEGIWHRDWNITRGAFGIKLALSEDAYEECVQLGRQALAGDTPRSPARAPRKRSPADERTAAAIENFVAARQEEP